MATEKQIAANRLNGLKGGVKTPEGKAISRMNARKHGIFAAALTEHDAEGLRGLLDEFIEHFKPVGIVEQLLVDKLAVTYMRMQRCAQAEALHYKYRWNMFPSNFGKFGYDETLVTIGLYDARLTKQFLRLLHEIEQRKKARAQEGQRDMAQPTESVSLSNRPPAVEPPPSQAMPAPGAGDREGPAPHTENELNPAEEPPATGENSGPAKLQNEPNSSRELPASVVTSRLDSSRKSGTGDDESDPTAKEPEMKNEPTLAAQSLATVERSLDPRAPIDAGDRSCGNDRPETPAPIPQVRNEPNETPLTRSAGHCIL